MPSSLSLPQSSADIPGLDAQLAGKETAGAAASAVVAHRAEADATAHPTIDSRIAALEAAPGGGVTDHGALTGLADDDHAQYHTDARGDARYSPLGHNHTGTYDPAGTGATEAAAAVGTHEAAPDPHPGYALESTLGTAATHNVPATGDATATEVVKGTDTRLTNARTPSAHAASHATGQSDAIAPADIGAATATHNHDGTYEPALGNPASDGYVLSSTAAGARSWIAAGGSTIIEPRSGVEVMEDFIMNGGSNVLMEKAVGTGGSFLTETTPSGLAFAPGHQGIAKIINSTAGSYAFCGAAVWNPIKAAQGDLVYEALVALHDLPTAGDDLRVLVGFAQEPGGWGNLSTATLVEAACFELTSANADWQVRCARASSQTTAATGVNVVAQTWYRLRVEVAADSSQVRFYVNGTLTNTLTTNTPTGWISYLTYSVRKASSANANRIVYVDYCYLKTTLTTAR